MVVVTVLMRLVRMVDRGGVDGRFCGRLTGRAVGGAGEQRHEADRDDRADLSGPPGQLGETAKSLVPRVVRGMAGPGRVTGVGIVVRPDLAPGRRRPRGIRRWMGRLAKSGIRSIGGWRIWSMAGRGIGRLAGQGGVTPVGVVGRPIGRTALHGAAVRRMAVGVAEAGVLSCPIIRVARRPGRGEVWVGGGNGTAGVVLALAGICPVRAAGLPGPAGFRFFIVVTHTNSTAQPLLRAPEEVFNKLLRQAVGHVISRRVAPVPLATGVPGVPWVPQLTALTAFTR
jgi:hypothetical protein